MDENQLFQALSNVIFNAFKHSGGGQRSQVSVSVSLCSGKEWGEEGGKGFQGMEPRTCQDINTLINDINTNITPSSSSLLPSSHSPAAPFPPSLSFPPRSQKYLLFLVEDNGKGVPKEERTRIFDQYTVSSSEAQFSALSSLSLSSSSSPFPFIPQEGRKVKTGIKKGEPGLPEGAGLGLFISRRLIEGMGGGIGVTDRVDGGKGACFWITLPLNLINLEGEEREEGEEEEEEVEEGEGEGEGEGEEVVVVEEEEGVKVGEREKVGENGRGKRQRVGRGGKKGGKVGVGGRGRGRGGGRVRGREVPEFVVVIDDNDLNRMILCKMLARLGVGKVETFECPLEALERFGEEGFDKSAVCIFFFFFFFLLLLSLILPLPQIQLILSDLNMPKMSGLEFTRQYVATNSSSSLSTPICLFFFFFFFFLFPFSFFVLFFFLLTITTANNSGRHGRRKRTPNRRM